jgi:sugar porter (SP) family MFS transporter
MNGTLIRTVLVTALGGMLLGFDTAVISGATRTLSQTFSLTPAALGVTVSAALWGTVVGAIAAGPMGRKWGGRTSLLVLSSCYFVSALGCAVSPAWDSLIFFRFIGGLGMGGSSVVAPVYIAEVAPARQRGRLVGAFQLNIIAGILLAYLSNFAISFGRFGIDEWRWELGVAAIPALVFFLFLLRNPESPRWLAARGRVDEAVLALQKLGAPDPAGTLNEIRKAISEDRGDSDRLFRWRYRRPIFLAISLAALNQLIGINAVLYYLNDIFAMAGFDRTSQHLQAVVIGLVMLAATAGALSLIDRFGRRTLLLTGSVGLAVCLGGIAAIFQVHRFEYLLLAFLIGYVAFFAFSQGAVIFVYLSEIFPTPARAQGQSLGCSTHWVMNAIISTAFPMIAVRSHSGPFYLFLVMVIIQFFAVLLVFPETARLSLEDMQRSLNPDAV